MAGYDETLRSVSLDADASIGIRTGVPGMPGSLAPNGGKQFYFVDITGVHECGIPAAAGGDAVGVLQNKPQHVGDAATVGYLGVSLVVAGGTLTAADKVSCDVNGAAVTASGSSTVLGKCIIGAAVGQLAVILLRMN